MAFCAQCKGIGTLVSEESGLVCVECGSINQPEAGSWETPGDHASGQTFVTEYQVQKIPGLRESSVYSRREEGHLSKSSLDYKMLKLLERIGDFMKLPDYLQSNAKKLYREIPFHRHSITSVKKLCVAASLYITARQNDIPITLKHLSEITSYPKTHLCRVYLNIKDVLQLDIPYLSLEAHAISFCSGRHLDGKVQRQMLDLIPLFRGVHIELHYHDKVLPPLAFVAYMAVNVRLDPKLTFTNFAQKLGITIGRLHRDELQKFMRVLCLICKEIPWAKHIDFGTTGLKINKLCYRNIFYYIDDAVKHHRVLTLEFSKTVEEGNDSVESWSETEEISQPTLGGETKHEQVACEEPPSVKLDDSSAKSVKLKPGLLHSVQEATKAKVYIKVHSEPEQDIIVNHDLDNEELCEEDLTEDELGLYIKTEKEVECIQTIKGELDETEPAQLGAEFPGPRKRRKLCADSSIRRIK